MRNSCCVCAAQELSAGKAHRLVGVVSIERVCLYANDCQVLRARLIDQKPLVAAAAILFRSPLVSAAAGVNGMSRSAVCSQCVLASAVPGTLPPPLTCD